MYASIKPETPAVFAWPTGQHEEVRTRIATHRRYDEIVQGTGWFDGIGCAIGCSLDKYNHEEYARILGIPVEIAELVDIIHEGLPRELALDWPGRVANALQPGSETTHAWSRFAIWLLRELLTGKASERIIVLYERRVRRDEPSAREWEQVREQAKKEAGVNAKAVALMAARTSWHSVREIEYALGVIEDTIKVERSYQRQADALIGILSANA